MSVESAEQGFTLLTLILSTPLTGVRKRWPNVLHAVEMEGLPIKTWPDGLAKSVCGKVGLRCVQWHGTLILWPPAVKGLPGMRRCRECFDRCKKKRPRSKFVRKVA